MGMPDLADRAIIALTLPVATTVAEGSFRIMKGLLTADRRGMSHDTQNRIPLGHGEWGCQSPHPTMGPCVVLHFVSLGTLPSWRVAGFKDLWYPAFFCCL